jgi:hypothetical protein
MLRALPGSSGNTQPWQRGTSTMLLLLLLLLFRGSL